MGSLFFYARPYVVFESFIILISGWETGFRQTRFLLFLLPGPASRGESYFHRFVLLFCFRCTIFLIRVKLLFYPGNKDNLPGCFIFITKVKNIADREAAWLSHKGKFQGKGWDSFFSPEKGEAQGKAILARNGWLPIRPVCRHSKVNPGPRC